MYNVFDSTGLLMVTTGAVSPLTTSASDAVTEPVPMGSAMGPCVGSGTSTSGTAAVNAKSSTTLSLEPGFSNSIRSIKVWSSVRVTTRFVNSWVPVASLITVPSTSMTRISTGPPPTVSRNQKSTSDAGVVNTTSAVDS